MHWVLGLNGLGFGIPTKHVYSDRITSNIGEEFSKQLGIVWKYTASHSPQRNGSCEWNHWTVDRKFEKSIKDSQGQVDLKRCLAWAINDTNTTIRDNTGFSPIQVLLGRAPRVPCIVKPQEVPKEHPTEHKHHTSTSHDAMETLQAIHKTRAKYRHARTVVQLNNVQSNRNSKYENRQYKPGDFRDFF